MNSINIKKEMLAVVKSDEAKKVFEEGLKNLDPKALSSDVIIQFYEIDFESIEHNPMGGINVKLKINNDNQLTAKYNLEKRDNNLEVDGINLSGKLANEIDGLDHE